MIEVFVLSVVVHELGHLLYFYSIGIKTSIHFSSKNWKLQVGYNKDYEGLTKRQLIDLYVSGIFSGLFVIAIYGNINPLNLIALPFYISGCKKDIKNILSIASNSNKYNC
jgi:hypothetical protein